MDRYEGYSTKPLPWYQKHGGAYLLMLLILVAMLLFALVYTRYEYGVARKHLIKEHTSEYSTKSHISEKRVDYLCKKSH